MRGCNFGTLAGECLFLPGCGAQQSAVTTAHQSDAALDQANDVAAQIMILPGAGKDTLLAEQDHCDVAIAISGRPAIEGSDHQNEPPATPGWKGKRRCTQPPATDSATKSLRGQHTYVGIGVERQFERKRCPLGY